MEGRGKLLLSTVHGSTLYGTSHENSDEDYYFVTEYGKSRQRKITLDDGREIDFIVIGLKSFLMELDKGTHQACDALFSKMKTVAPEYEQYFDNLRPYSVEARDRYMRVSKRLAYDDSLKKRVHAIRMRLNLAEYQHTGRFDPTLDHVAVALIRAVANLIQGDDLVTYMQQMIDNRPLSVRD